MIIASTAQLQTESSVEGNSVTITENVIENQDSTSANGTAETTESTAPEVKYPTYVELAKATWKLAFNLSSRGDEDTSRDYCVSGTNEFLELLELPSIGDVEDIEQADGYLDAWLKFKHWRATGELSPEDDAWLRTRLAGRVRNVLKNREPAGVDVMNQWLAELGLEQIVPPKHIGRYNVAHNANTTVNSAMIQEALVAAFPDAGFEVSYYARVQ